MKDAQCKRPHTVWWFYLYRNRNQISVVTRGCGWGERLNRNKHEETFGGDGKYSLSWVFVVGTPQMVYDNGFVITHSAAHLEQVHLIACKWSLNRVGSKKIKTDLLRIIKKTKFEKVVKQSQCSGYIIFTNNSKFLRGGKGSSGLQGDVLLVTRQDTRYRVLLL